MILSRVQPRYYIAGLTLGWGCQSTPPPALHSLKTFTANTPPPQ